MAAITVVFDGTRLTSADSSTGWGNFNVGGPSPASEPANAYQQDTPGSSVGAVGKKVTSTSTRQGVSYTGSSVDYLNNNYVWFCKIYVADSFDLEASYGVQVVIGTNSSNYRSFNIAGTLTSMPGSFSQYPAQGGYILAAIDPAITNFYDFNTSPGTQNAASITFYAVGAVFNTGTAKAENVAMDAIDYGTGLKAYGGGGADPDVTFLDFLEFDQNTKQNRYGVVAGSGNSMTCNAKLYLADASNSIVFNDSTTILTFIDSPIDEGKLGVFIDLSQSANDITVANTLIGKGIRRGSGVDERPDFDITGTVAPVRCLISANIRNFRKIGIPANVVVGNADIQAAEISVALNCTIQNSIIRTDAPTAGTPCFNLLFAGWVNNIFSNCEFIQTRNGACFSLVAGATYTFNNLTFTDYGSTGTASAALQCTGVGTVTVNINGGNIPTTYTPNGASFVFVNAKTVRVTVKDAVTLNPIQGVRVLLEAAAGGPLAAGTDILSGLTNVSGVIEDTVFNYTADQPVTGRARKGTTSPLYQQGSITGTITTNGFDTTILLISDE